jgi:hypothetical protein
MLSNRRYLALMACAALAVIAAVWLYVRTMPMAFLESGYPVWVARQTMLRGCDLGDVLILGDSRVDAAVVPTRLSRSGANLAFGGTTPLETYFFARRASQCPRKPKIVIWSHGLSTFDGVSELLWKTGARFGFLDFGELRMISAVAGGLHDDSVWDADTKDGLKGIARDAIYASGFPSVFLGSLVQGGLFQQYQRNVAMLGLTLARRGHAEYLSEGNQARIGKDADVTAFQPLPVQTAFFRMTLKTLSDMNVPVIILTTPIPESTARRMRPGVTDAFAAYLRAEAAQMPHVGLSGDPPLVWPDQWFSDAHHLDTEGANRFTDRLDHCLQRWLDDAARNAPPGRCDLSAP